MSERSTEPERLRCRSYTFARRYPLVIGKIGGWYPWWGPMTVTQYAVLVVTAVLLLQTRAVWAHMPGPVNLVVGPVVPLALAWLVRHARVEGRSPVRAAVGGLTYLAAPRRGVCHGRAVTTPRPQCPRGAAVPVSEHREP
ncbi:MAG: hypothetical protein WD250_15240 [Egibacteraceae bacterium]